MPIPVPEDLNRELERFEAFIAESIRPRIVGWYRSGTLPADFFRELSDEGWLGIHWEGTRLRMDECLRRCLLMERLAAVSPGAAVAVLAHVDLGFAGLCFYGTPRLQAIYGPSAVAGDLVLCLGNTEGRAGSDVAGIGMTARREGGAWRLTGAKAYVTNGTQAGAAVVTAVTDPDAERGRRLSMFFVDLNAPGVTRRKLNKQVWIPSDLTRITLDNVRVPEDHLLGKPGSGLQQVLNIFTHSRVPISALTLGTARGAFDLALDRCEKRRIFGRPITDFQAKAFEIAVHHARIEAARLMMLNAARTADSGEAFRMEASMAKLLAVDAARGVAEWAADLYGAASVIFDHPIHKYPMDAWAAAIGEGTQDIQKLVIFRELMARRRRVESPGS
ncbi:MAG: acyl-CoA dehydrogenase family protein [Desulfobacterales bacterium]